MALKNKYYTGEIIERFMTEKEQAEFDRKYKESRLVNVGKKTVHTGNWKEIWHKYI